MKKFSLKKITAAVSAAAMIATLGTTAFAANVIQSSSGITIKGITVTQRTDDSELYNVSVVYETTEVQDIGTTMLTYVKHGDALSSVTAYDKDTMNIVGIDQKNDTSAFTFTVTTDTSASNGIYMIPGEAGLLMLSGDKVGGTPAVATLAIAALKVTNTELGEIAIINGADATDTAKKNAIINAVGAVKFTNTDGVSEDVTLAAENVTLTETGATITYEGYSVDVTASFVAKASSGSAPGINKGSSTTTTYAVTVVETKNGTVTVSPEKAASGATVTVKPEPAEGYKVKSVTAVKADGTNVPVDEKAYTFTMPASAVKVTVEFEEGKDEPVNPTPDGKFADVADDFWAAKDIYTLKDAGIIGGKSATEFDPEGDVTRAEFAKMVVGLFGYKATSDAVNFEDCKAEDWFTPYVAAGVEAGVIKGVSDTEFAPNATITREDACTILGRALNKVAASNELKFTDADKVAEYAVPYVALLSELGYVNGYEDGSFAPTNNITRAEAAKIIAGIYNAKDSTEDKADNTDTIDVAPEK